MHIGAAFWSPLSGSLFSRSQVQMPATLLRPPRRMRSRTKAAYRHP